MSIRVVVAYRVVLVTIAYIAEEGPTGMPARGRGVLEERKLGDNLQTPDIKYPVNPGMEKKKIQESW